ncbi:hypothetical protein QTP86_007950 [Hemibagrus guttatus]|nr:hypothetical protein QTP86_007950 [Hemibagrus guttatus]
MDRTEENRQEYKELQRRVKREVSKAKQKAYDELYTRLDTREGEKDLYRLARQRDRDGKDVQQVRVIKDRDGRVLTSEESVQRRWKEYFEELMNEENEREKRVEGVNSVEQKVDKIRKDEVRKALKRMKSGKAVGPDDIPVEVWKCLGEAAMEFLTSLFNRVLESERMPEEWRSVLVPIFKNKGDVQSCSNYRGIKLMSHTMKLWGRVVEARLRKVVEICEQQYGFMPRKSTTDAIFALRILMEKYRDGQRELHCVFVDLEKAYDRVPREELWYCMRKSGVAEKYVRVVQDMYERSRTVVRCAVGQTEEFKVEVGLHQGSALSPFLFAIVMDQLSEEVRQESPWTMMFADDIVICSESREQVEENLERWRFALERRGMKVSGSKTEYMCVNEREGSGTVRLQGEEVKKVQEFKYLGSTVQSNGECGKEVKKRVQAGWNGWRKVWGVLCERKISARIKGKVYRTVVRAAMLYGLETVSLRKRQESELEVAELKMLKFSLGVTRLDRIRNEYIRGTAHVGRLGDKVREARLRWFGHVQRRETRLGSSACVEVDSDTEAVAGKEFRLGCISCKMRGEVEATATVDWWFMATGESNFTHIYSYSDKTGMVTDDRFRDRIEWVGSKNTLDLQDGSLKVLNVSYNDTGTYRCYFDRTLSFTYYEFHTNATKFITINVVAKATRGMASILSEVMMYVSIIGLQLWLLVEMVYCYRKIAAAGEEALRESASLCGEGGLLTAGNLIQSFTSTAKTRSSSGHSSSGVLQDDVGVFFTGTVSGGGVLQDDVGVNFTGNVSRGGVHQEDVGVVFTGAVSGGRGLQNDVGVYFTGAVSGGGVLQNDVGVFFTGAVSGGGVLQDDVGVFFTGTVSGGGVLQDDVGVVFTGAVSGGGGLQNDVGVYFTGAVSGGGVLQNDVGVYFTGAVSGGGVLQNDVGVYFTGAVSGGGVLQNNVGVYFIGAVSGGGVNFRPYH